MKTHQYQFAIIFVLAALLAVGCSSSQTAAPTTQPAAATVAVSGSPDGQALLAERCTKCHNLDRVHAAKKTADEWKTTVSRMMGKGAQLTSEEETVLLDYLAKTYPK
jgi:hypothetical protein